MSFINTILDPVFGPILLLGPFWGIMIISLVISVLMSIIYKYMTDQKQMKQFKDDIKSYQQEMKKQKDSPKKMMEIQKKAMEVNMQYMMQSLKPTLVTFIPIIIIFAWLSSHLVYEPVKPGYAFNTTIYFQEEFNEVTLTTPNYIDIVGNQTKTIENRKATFKAKPSKEGEYLLTFKFDKNEYNKEVVVTQNQKYAEPVKSFNDGVVEKIEISQPQLKILNLFGWQLGWIGSYIIFSIIFSIATRKIMKLY